MKKEVFLTSYFGGLLSRPPPEGFPGFLLGQPPLPLPTFFTSLRAYIDFAYSAAPANASIQASGLLPDVFFQLQILVE
jgi:hypothetical protein